jgi:hypothetical protein
MLSPPMPELPNRAATLSRALGQLACRFNPADDACTLPHLKVATIKQLLGQLNGLLIIVTGNDMRWPRDAIAGEQSVDPIMRHAALPQSQARALSNSQPPTPEQGHLSAIHHRAIYGRVGLCKTAHL